LGLGPSSFPRERLETLEIGVVEVDLERLGHDLRLYEIMSLWSTDS
jgi:hypothetical protein